METIPLCDLKAQYATIREELLRVTEEVLASTNFIGGPYVAAFERDYVALHEARAGVGCANGTAAIRLALEALGVGPSDEVITTPHTFVATVEAILQVGATPVLVDIDPRTYNIDPRRIRERITPKTRALLPVHLYGNPCDLPALQAIATEHHLWLIEDSAQAHFAKLNGVFIGTQSDAATFSFYPGKNLGAAGDAGFVFAKSCEVVERVRALANHGRTQDKYRHHVVGTNDRIDALQAAILSVKLKHILAWTARRRQLGAAYTEVLRPKGFKTIESLDGAECVYHQYVVEVSNREDVLRKLAEKGISAQIHYPVPIHQQPAFAGKAWTQCSMPETERAASRVMSLPLYPEITDVQVERVLTEFLRVAEV